MRGRVEEGAAQQILQRVFMHHIKCSGAAHQQHLEHGDGGFAQAARLAVGRGCHLRPVMLHVLLRYSSLLSSRRSSDSSVGEVDREVCLVQCSNMYACAMHGS